MSPSPKRAHQEICGQLFLEIGNFLKDKSCKVYSAPFDVRLPGNRNDPDKNIFTVVQPDICVICDPSKLDESGCNGAPDLIVEVLSESTARKDLKDKFELYEESGVMEYW